MSTDPGIAEWIRSRPNIYPGEHTFVDLFNGTRRTIAFDARRDTQRPTEEHAPDCPCRAPKEKS